MRISGVLKGLYQRPVRSLSNAMTIHEVFFYALTVLIAGCATTGPTHEFNKPYGVVRSTVQKAMPRGIRTTSRNGRTYESNFFIPKGNWDDDGTDAKDRAFARATILGSSRPYQVEIDVFRQHKQGPGGYSGASRDSELSERLAKKIADDIANRREDRNIIDDFKPF